MVHDRSIYAVSLSIILITSVLLPQIISSGSATPAEPHFKLSAIRAQDTNGNDLGNIIRTGQQIVLTVNSTNEGNSAQSFAGLLQISDPDGTAYLARQTGTASAGDSILFEFTWETEKVGIYTIQAFLWSSLDSPTALSNPSETRMEVSVIPTAKVQITSAVLTPLQESLQKSIDELKSEGKPHPTVRFETKTEVPTPSEITASIESEGSFITNITAQTIIEYDGPEEAGKEKWDDIIVENPEPPTTSVGSNNSEVLLSGNLTQMVIDEYPEIYGEGNGTYQYGEEPRTFVVDEVMAITFVESENATAQLQDLISPVPQTDSSNTVMGFSYVPKKIEYEVNPKVKVWIFTIAEARAKFVIDAAFGIRLPIQVDVTRPESMVAGREYNIDTSITPLDFSPEQYESMGLPVENGHEFFARFNGSLELIVKVVYITVINKSIEMNVDLGELCTRNSDLDCQDFVTPFGSDENGVNREFPLPSLDLSPDRTGLEYTMLGIISIGLGLRIDPEFGSDKISAVWFASGDASGSGNVVYTAAYPSQYQVGPILALGDSDIDDVTLTGQAANRSAVITLDDYKFHLNRQIIAFYGNLQLELLGRDIAQTRYVKLLELNFTKIIGVPVFGQHEGVGGISSTIPVIADEVHPDEAEQIRIDMMSIAGVVGVSVNATHVSVILENIESTVRVPTQVGDRQVFRDVSGPVCTLLTNDTNPCQAAWEELGNEEFVKARLLNIPSVSSVSFEDTTILVFIDNEEVRNAIPDKISGKTIRVESGSEPTPIDRPDVSECLGLFSGAATSPYTANRTITIDSMQSSYQVDFDYRIAHDFDSDTFQANNVASNPPNVSFLERDTISLVLFGNDGIGEDVVSLYHKDVSDCDILFTPFVIPATDKVVLDTLSIEQIESNNTGYLVKVVIPDKIDVSDDYNKLVVQYMDNEESAVIYVVPDIEIEPVEASDSEVASCYNLFNGTMTTPTVADNLISINAVHGTYNVEVDYSRIEDDLDSRGFVYYLNLNSSDAEDTILVEGEKITFTIRSNGGGTSTDSEDIVTLYAQDVSDCDIVFQPDSIPSSKILQLGSTNVTDLADGTYLHEVVIPSRSVVGDDFTKLFISYKDETESRVYYSLPNLRIIASVTNDGQNVDVSITNGSSTKTSDAYSPNPITINVGDTVTWTNDDSELHTVTSGTNATSDGKFDSSPDYDPLMLPGATFSHTFTEAGEYPYYCALHPDMAGTVIVAAQ